jgi:predicted cupin superfamily sugar epimerase
LCRPHGEAVNDFSFRYKTPHPEGGHYRRVYESAQCSGDRPALTGIVFLLAQGECSRWHRVDADECWHWQQGGEVELLTWDASTATLQRQRVGPYAVGSEPMRVVPAGVWQAARVVGDYCLVACTVSPGFVWQGFAMLDDTAALATQLRAIGAWPS